MSIRGEQQGRDRFAVEDKRRRHCSHGHHAPRDGWYATIRAIGRSPALKTPIVAVTAKAMKGDQEKCTLPELPTTSPSP
jgi:hypothetical protein